ncbi:MAG: ABC transporter permease, partial [Geminicoccaceae bacterium]
MSVPLGLAFRFAWRELRQGLSGFAVFLACLTLGVAAIATVGVINAGVLAGLEEDSAALLGGDIKIQSTNQPVEEETLAALLPDIASRRGDVVRTNAMAYAGFSSGEGRRVVVGLKAVDDAYPLIGTVALDPPELTMNEALSDQGAVVERGLLARLGIEIGSAIRIGEADFTVRAVVDREPDRVGGFISIGPRVFIHLDDLPKTAVIQPGSLARYGYRFALPGGLDAAPILSRIKRENPEVRWQASGVRDIQPRVTRVVDRLASYLTIA